jgi:putative FmdB family regulatory protein
MPIFEYSCRECGHAFETLVRSDTVPQCPHCQSQALDKQLSVFATTTDSATAAAPMMPGSCGSCGHPGGPGACGFN